MMDEPYKITPAPPLTTDVDLLGYALFDNARRMLRDGFTPEEAAAHFQALLAQSADRIPHDGTGTVTTGDPWIIRFVVRRDAGPIRLVIGGVYPLVDVEYARAACLRLCVLVVPGMPFRIDPHDAILLGQRVSAREAIAHYHDSSMAAAIGTSTLLSSLAAPLSVGELRDLAGLPPGATASPPDETCACGALLPAGHVLCPHCEAQEAFR